MNGWRIFIIHKDNQELHDVVEYGLVKAFEDGDLWKWFKSNPRNKGLFTKADLKGRTRIVIDNPYLSEGFKKIPEKYFFNLNMLD